MRCIPVAMILGVLGCAAALADELHINQNGSTNFSFVAVTQSDASNVRINQEGHTNVVSAAQLAPDLNQIATTQSGWSNTVVIYQQGFIDIASVAQSGPGSSPPKDMLPTAYHVRETDQGFLSTFTSGELSIATLTSPELTYISHFGRRH